MMKKYFLLLVLSVCVSMANAQLIKQGEQTQKKQSDLDWYNCSFSEEGVFGAEVNKAYEFLKGKKLKKRPVVALVGTGIDVEHEYLKQAIWVNPKAVSYTHLYPIYPAGTGSSTGLLMTVLNNYKSGLVWIGMIDVYKRQVRRRERDDSWVRHGEGDRERGV